MEFKKGDKVRILDGSDIERYAGGWLNYGMKKYVGKVVTIKSVVPHIYGRVGYFMEEIGYVWDERGLEPGILRL